MRRARKVEWLYSALSFVAAFLFTHGIFEKLCNRVNSEDFDLERKELIYELHEVDTVKVGPERPRDLFFYTNHPWRVQQRLNNDSFLCPETQKADQIKIVVFIKSAANYSVRRTTVRSTWGGVSHLENMVMHVVFVIGMASPDVQKTIDTEEARHGDILQYMGLDDYRHIVYKVLAGMQWAKYHLPNDHFYATSDDDILFNMTDLPRQLRLRMRRAKQDVPESRPLTVKEQLSRVPILCVLSYRKREKPVRDIYGKVSKYYLDPREYRYRRLPPYCLGGLYVMPAERVSKLHDVARVETALPMDDVWITGMLRQKIRPQDLDAIDHSAESRNSMFAEHLGRDAFGAEVSKVSEIVLKKWSEIYKIVKLKKHCLRDRFLKK